MAPALDVYDASSKENRTVAALGKTTSGKSLKIRSYPKFESLEEERLYRKQHLAAAFRVFADRGFDEGVAGHISVRDPILTDHFCKSQDLSFSVSELSEVRYRWSPGVGGGSHCIPSTTIHHHHPSPRVSIEALLINMSFVFSVVQGSTLFPNTLAKSVSVT